jgi:hypothetical protein
VLTRLRARDESERWLIDAWVPQAGVATAKLVDVIDIANAAPGYLVVQQTVVLITALRAAASTADGNAGCALSTPA